MAKTALKIVSSSKFGLTLYLHFDTLYLSRVFQIENGVFSDSENSSYVLSGTFYGIKKSCSVVAWWCREVGAYPEILYILGTLVFFNRKIGQNYFFLPQIVFGTQFLAKLLHFMGSPNVTCDFGHFFDFGPFLGCRSWKMSKNQPKMAFLQFRHPKNGPKSKNWPKSQVTFGEPMKWNNLAKNWVPNTTWGKNN